MIALENKLTYMYNVNGDSKVKLKERMQYVKRELARSVNKEARANSYI